jgi:hypothetical protein
VSQRFLKTQPITRTRSTKFFAGLGGLLVEMIGSAGGMIALIIALLLLVAVPALVLVLVKMAWKAIWN